MKNTNKLMYMLFGAGAIFAYLAYKDMKWWNSLFKPKGNGTTAPKVDEFGMPRIITGGGIGEDFSNEKPTCPPGQEAQNIMNCITAPCPAWWVCKPTYSNNPMPLPDDGGPMTAIGMTYQQHLKNLEYPFSGTLNGITKVYTIGSPSVPGGAKGKMVAGRKRLNAGQTVKVVGLHAHGPKEFYFITDKGFISVGDVAVGDKLPNAMMEQEDSNFLGFTGLFYNACGDILPHEDLGMEYP